MKYHLRTWRTKFFAIHVLLLINRFWWDLADGVVSHKLCLLAKTELLVDLASVPSQWWSGSVWLPLRKSPHIIWPTPATLMHLEYIMHCIIHTFSFLVCLKQRDEYFIEGMVDTYLQSNSRCNENCWFSNKAIVTMPVSCYDLWMMGTGFTETCRLVAVFSYLPILLPAKTRDDYPC